MNPWSSRVQTPDNPDWCIIDLDPAENTFNQVIEAANVTNDILKSMGATSYAKTSGSTGIHIYIPLGGKYTYEQSKEFARVIATLVQREIPKYTSIERIVKARKGKIIAIITEGDTLIPKMVDFTIEVPRTNDLLLPLLTSIPLQLISYYIAVMRGRNVDQPRNLAKSVTVE